jgi:hypothetical protein
MVVEGAEAAEADREDPPPPSLGEDGQPRRKRSTTPRRNAPPKGTVVPPHGLSIVEIKSKFGNCLPSAIAEFLRKSFKSIGQVQQITTEKVRLDIVKQIRLGGDGLVPHDLWDGMTPVLDLAKTSWTVVNSSQAFSEYCSHLGSEQTPCCNIAVLAACLKWNFAMRIWKSPSELGRHLRRREVLW